MITNSISQYDECNEQFTVSPRVDVFEDDNTYLLLTDLPGVVANDIEVQYETDQLQLKVARSSSGENETPAYARSFRVHGVDQNSIRAELKNGVLKLELPKSEPVKPRKVPVQTQ